MVHTRLSSPSADYSVASASHSRSKSKKMKAHKTNAKQKSEKMTLAFGDCFGSPPQGLTYEIAKEKHKGAKICTINRYDPITELRSLLSKEQLADFRKSCFGHFLALPNFKIQHQLIHNLLLRQLKQPNINEIWIGVAGVKLKFGIEEFAAITGLLCVGNANKMQCSNVENSFISTYYNGCKAICKSSVKTTLYSKEWKNDVDAVKIAKLYFLHNFLLTSSTDAHIPKGDLDLLDSNKFDEFPWGKEVFRLTLDSLKSGAKTSSVDNYYRLCGFPYAFQVWFYECCPYLNGKYCSRDVDSICIPRIMKWTTDYCGTFKEFYTTLSIDFNELQVRDMIATAKEIEEWHLDELGMKISDCKRISNEASVTVSDDDFMEPAPRTNKDVSTSVKPVKPVSTSLYPSFKKLQSQMKKVEANQSKLVSEVEELKCIVKEQRSYFDLELAKIRDLILNKVGGGHDAHDTPYFDENNDGYVPGRNPFNEVSNVEVLVAPVGQGKTVCTDDIHDDANAGFIVADEYSPTTMTKLEYVCKDVEDSFAKRTAKGVEEAVRVVEAMKTTNVDVVGKEKVVGAKISQINLVSAVLEEVEQPLYNVREVAEDMNEVEAIAKSGEDSVIQVAREVGRIHGDNDTMDDVEKVFAKTMDDMKDAGVYQSKVIVLHTAGGGDTSGLVKATPAVPKRLIKLPAYLQSPFLQHYGSSSKSNLEASEVRSLKSIYPLDDNIGQLPDMEIMTGYYNWLEKGLLMNKNKKNFYTKKDNTIKPPLKLGSYSISEKTWFHSLEYGSTPLLNSHIDVFFYYLRKMSKQTPACSIRFTTTDCTFQSNLVIMLGEITEVDHIQTELRAKRSILDVIKGNALAFNTPWWMVDYVLLPVCLPEQKHWLLGILDFNEREIVICNSLSGPGNYEMIKDAFLPFSNLLPFYLQLTDFYSRADINFLSKAYSAKSKDDPITTILKNKYPRGKSIDSAIYMMSFAQYFVEQKEVSKEAFDVSDHRTSISFSLYSYAMAKDIYGYVSEPEFLADAEEHGHMVGICSPKRTRGAKDQTKKRKAADHPPKCKKEKKKIV